MPCAGCRRSARSPWSSRATTRATEINGAVNRGEAFAGAFPGETEGELDALRELFHRKALVARQARLCEELLDAGATPEEVTARRVADLPDDPGARRCLELRGTGHRERSATRPPSSCPTARRSRRADLTHWLRMARLVRHEPRGQRRHLPLAAGRPVRHQRPRGGGGMNAARLHEYHQALKLDSVEEPKVDRPVRRRREDRGRGALPHRPAHPGRAVGREVRGRPPLHARATRTRAGSTRSAPASRTSRSATP